MIHPSENAKSKQTLFCQNQTFVVYPFPRKQFKIIIESIDYSVLLLPAPFIKQWYCIALFKFLRSILIMIFQITWTKH